MRLGMGEMLVVLVVALLVFGPNKLPQLGDALGKGIRNFKKAAEGEPEPSTTSQAQLPAAQAQLPRAEGAVAREAEQARTRPS